MTLLRYLFDSQPSGTTATTDNTGASIITTGNGASGTVTFSSAFGVNGSTGLRTNTTATGGSVGARYSLTAPSDQLQLTVVAKMPVSAPAGPVNLIALRYAGGVGGRVIWSTGGKLQFSDTVHTITDITSTGVLALNTQYHITITSVGASDTAGQVTVKAYALNDTTFSSPLANTTISNANLTTNNYTDIQLCEGSAIADVGFDTLQFNNGAGTEIPYFASSNVTVNDISDQTVEPETSVSYTATSPQTISTWTWRQVSGPTITLTGSGATRSFTAPSIMPPGADIVIAVKGAFNGVDSAESQATITVQPQIRWQRSGSTWVGQRPSL